MRKVCVRELWQRMLRAFAGRPIKELLRIRAEIRRKTMHFRRTCEKDEGRVDRCEFADERRLNGGKHMQHMHNGLREMRNMVERLKSTMDDKLGGIDKKIDEMRSRLDVLSSLDAKMDAVLSRPSEQ